MRTLNTLLTVINLLALGSEPSTRPAGDNHDVAKVKADPSLVVLPLHYVDKGFPLGESTTDSSGPTLRTSGQGGRREGRQAGTGRDRFFGELVLGTRPEFQPDSTFPDRFQIQRTPAPPRCASRNGPGWRAHEGQGGAEKARADRCRTGFLPATWTSC